MLDLVFTHTRTNRDYTKSSFFTNRLYFDNGNAFLIYFVFTQNRKSLRTHILNKFLTIR
jgi:hypothetical protein